MDPQISSLLALHRPQRISGAPAQKKTVSAQMSFSQSIKKSHWGQGLPGSPRIAMVWDTDSQTMYSFHPVLEPAITRPASCSAPSRDQERWHLANTDWLGEIPSKSHWLMGKPGTTVWLGLWAWPTRFSPYEMPRDSLLSAHVKIEWSRLRDVTMGWFKANI
jgi:hypothetical protein